MIDLEKPTRTLSDVSLSDLALLSRSTSIPINAIEDMLVTLWEMGEREQSDQPIAKSEYYLPEYHSIIVYDDIVERLLTDKSLPLYTQFVVHVGAEMGFRTAEIGTLCFEHLFPNEKRCLVYDSKKYKFFMVPLGRTCLKLADEISAQSRRIKGPILVSRTTPGRPFMSPQNIWKLMQVAVEPMNLPEAIHIKPRTLREYFILDALRRLCENYHDMPYNPELILPLCAIVRHGNPWLLYLYCKRLMGWTDIQRAYERYEEAHERHLAGLPQHLKSEKELEAKP